MLTFCSNVLAAEAPKSSSEAKDRLEELRARLTQKCESLQKRREALYSKMKANNSTPERMGTVVPQRDNAEVERDSSSIPLDFVDHVKQQALQKVEVNSTTREGHVPLAPKKSGKQFILSINKLALRSTQLIHTQPPPYLRTNFLCFVFHVSFISLLFRPINGFQQLSADYFLWNLC